MAIRRAFAGWVVAALVSCVLTAALARVFIRVKPEAESVGYAWFAAPGAALALILLFLGRKHLVTRAKDLARGHIHGGEAPS